MKKPKITTENIIKIALAILPEQIDLIQTLHYLFKTSLMKTKLTERISLKVLMLFILGTTFCSCSPLQYQVLEVSGDDKTIQNNVLLSSNDDLDISYNFWSFGGNVAFTIYNKTDKPIFLDWDKSHFIIGGISYEYWYDIEENTQVALAKSMSKSGFLSSYSDYNSFWGFNTTKTISTIQKSKPKQILQIPPKSTIYVQKYSILNKPFFTCDFNFQSNPQHTINKDFTKNDSPISFRNYLTYSFDKTCDSSKVVDDNFYISKIFNMDKKVFEGERKTEDKCNINGRIYPITTYDYPFYKPNRFYWDIKAK